QKRKPHHRPEAEEREEHRRPPHARMCDQLRPPLRAQDVDERLDRPVRSGGVEQNKRCTGDGCRYESAVAEGTAASTAGGDDSKRRERIRLWNGRGLGKGR